MFLGIAFVYAVKGGGGKETVYITSVPSHSVPTREKSPKTSHVINHHLNNAGQWYEVKIEPDIVSWQLRARGDHEIYYAFEPTHYSYMTLLAGDSLNEDTVPNKDINAVYVMSNDAGTIVEMECWYK